MTRTLVVLAIMLAMVGGSGAADAESGMEPAGANQLIGRWVPADGAGAHDPKPAFVEFAPDGRWTGSDGCNAQRGRWRAGPDGTLWATAGPSTKIGCSNVPVAAWLVDASRAALDGGTLVLLAADGREHARLTRA
ncbi:heat shock protein HslJ [Pseudonocardia eucalypti]|nr:heat shock protein HslJ [Pseudonocardia eucalypti]